MSKLTGPEGLRWADIFLKTFTGVHFLFRTSQLQNQSEETATVSVHGRCYMCLMYIYHPWRGLAELLILIGGQCEGLETRMS